METVMSTRDTRYVLTEQDVHDALLAFALGRCPTDGDRKRTSFTLYDSSHVGMICKQEGTIYRNVAAKIGVTDEGFDNDIRDRLARATP